jgi:hypothetical protein
MLQVIADLSSDGPSSDGPSSSRLRQQQLKSRRVDGGHYCLGVRGDQLLSGATRNRCWGLAHKLPAIKGAIPLAKALCSSAAWLAAIGTQILS